MVSLGERIRIASGGGRTDFLIKYGRVANAFTDESEMKEMGP